MPGLHNVIFGSGGAALAQIHLLKKGIKGVGTRPSKNILTLGFLPTVIFSKRRKMSSH